MNKKKKITFVLLLLLVAGVGTWLLFNSIHRAPVLVVGSLTSKEVAEITSAVRQQMWHSTFSGFTWKKIPALPKSIVRNLTAHIAGVYGDSDSAFVLVANGKSKPPMGYMAYKGPKGWVCGGAF